MGGGMRHVVIAASWFLFALPAAYAASFDCGKAAAGAEKLICADPELSRLDENLAAAYHRARESAHDPVAFREQQRRWLSDVRQRCSDANCLKAAYTERIAQLVPAAQAGGAVPASGGPRFELAPLRCRFTLTPAWKKALSGKPVISGDTDVFVDGVKLIDIPGQDACGVVVSGSELTYDDAEMRQASCPDPYDHFQIWHEVTGKIAPLSAAERGWNVLYPLRDTQDGHLYYLEIYGGDRCFPASANLLEWKQINSQWSFVAASKIMQSAFDAQCSDAAKIDSCLGVAAQPAYQGAAPSDFIRAHERH